MAVDAQNMPFRDGVFDKIVCTGSLEHIPDDAADREPCACSSPAA
jgi:ubiquinone/menaquinone biosynthesis C-methylase UbiE